MSIDHSSGGLNTISRIKDDWRQSEFPPQQGGQGAHAHQLHRWTQNCLIGTSVRSPMNKGRSAEAEVTV